MPRKGGYFFLFVAFFLRVVFFAVFLADLRVVFFAAFFFRFTAKADPPPSDPGKGRSPSPQIRPGTNRAAEVRPQPRAASLNMTSKTERIVAASVDARSELHKKARRESGRSVRRYVPDSHDAVAIVTAILPGSIPMCAENKS